VPCPWPDEWAQRNHTRTFEQKQVERNHNQQQDHRVKKIPRPHIILDGELSWKRWTGKSMHGGGAQEKGTVRNALTTVNSPTHQGKKTMERKPQAVAIYAVGSHTVLTSFTKRKRGKVERGPWRPATYRTGAVYLRRGLEL